MKKRFIAIAMAFAATAMLCTSIPAFAATTTAPPKKITLPIDKDTALEIALEDSGYTREEAEDVEIEKGHEDGKEVYEVEFYVGVSKYEYDIEISTGEIIEYNIDD